MTSKMISGALLAALFTVAATSSGSAGQAVMPVIERPKLTAAQAIAIAEKQLTNDPARYLLVGVDWAKADGFQPRFTDGTQFIVLRNEQPDSFSWFVTYVFKDDQRVQSFAKLGFVREFTSIRVIRVKDDGTARAMMGVN